MKRKRHTPEQVIRKLREAEVLQGQGQSLGQVCQKLAVSEQTFNRWRAEYGTVPGEAMRRLKELEAENTRLKKAVADITLDKQILEEAVRGKW